MRIRLITAFQSLTACLLVAATIGPLFGQTQRHLQTTTPNEETVQELTTPTGASLNKAPSWAKSGAYVYRISTPDAPNVLPSLEEGIGITSSLLDRSVVQIPIIMGLIGHDHLGGKNWDGPWPYWDKVTFRAGNWERLSSFMKAANEKYDTKITFHLNITDVNIGLKDYPETRDFFKKLVATKSIFRRDPNPVTDKPEGKPYVPKVIPPDDADPRNIFAIVNYKNYWDSGLAKNMIDRFYAHLPYPPPIIYLDVLSTTGNNLNVGLPDDALGRGEATQAEGIHDIGAYLHSKGTDIAIESDRPFVSPWATYSWRSTRGVSADDYSMISGGTRQLPWQQVAGATGDFSVSPIASTPAVLARVKEHYANLLAGKTDKKIMPGLVTWHISDRAGTDDQFDPNRGKRDDEFDMIPRFDREPAEGGDPFRGDWIDLVNNFYLTGIQDLYFIGKHAFRTAIFNQDSTFSLSKMILTGPDGKETVLPYTAFLDPSVTEEWRKMLATEGGQLVLQTPYNMRATYKGLRIGAYSGPTALQTHLSADQSGVYRVRVAGTGSAGAMNLYLNGHFEISRNDLPSHAVPGMTQTYDVGKIFLHEGDNLVSIDSGPLYTKWSDGTEALWTTPGIHKGLKIANGDVTFADDYDRMWPDTWSGQKKIYFFSWEGTSRAWKLPQNWGLAIHADLYPLTPNGRGAGMPLRIRSRSVSPKLLPQIPYVLVPRARDRR